MTKSEMELLTRVCAAVIPATPPPRTRTCVRRHSVNCRLGLIVNPKAASERKRTKSVNKDMPSLVVILGQQD